jgi:hypothetical protein
MGKKPTELESEELPTQESQEEYDKLVEKQSELIHAAINDYINGGSDTELKKRLEKSSNLNYISENPHGLN